jgi:perosamine synthetase
MRVFSFYPTKQITTGEGGILITNDKKLIDKIKILNFTNNFINYL